PSPRRQSPSSTVGGRTHTASIVVLNPLQRFSAPGLPPPGDPERPSPERKSPPATVSPQSASLTRLGSTWWWSSMVVQLSPARTQRHGNRAAPPSESPERTNTPSSSSPASLRRRSRSKERS